VRISAAQRAENETRIRAAMDRLLRGEIPPGGKCDIKTLAQDTVIAELTDLKAQAPWLPRF
jgi:hypothetical protein